MDRDASRQLMKLHYETLQCDVHSTSCPNATLAKDEKLCANVLMMQFAANTLDTLCSLVKYNESCDIKAAD